jgi:hypothetical protein
MEFKDIKQWSVQKGIATPVNPYPTFSGEIHSASLSPQTIS